MKASQHPTELEFLVNKARGKSSFLEIGSRYGETLKAIGQVLRPGATIVCVDLPDGPWGRSNSAPVLKGVCRNLHLEYGHNVVCLLGNSTDPEIVKTVEGHGPFDLVFIDGDHRYEGVRSDWLNYGHLGEYVAFHDIAARVGATTPSGEAMEVPKLWAEVAEQYPHETCIGRGSPMGVGVLRRHA